MKNILILFCFLSAMSLFAQPVAIIPSPAGFDGSGHGYWANGITYNGNYYFGYEANNGDFSLAKYDGTTLTIIPNPNGMEYAGHPIVHGGFLYLKYSSITYFDEYLTRWDGNTLTLINNPWGYGGRGYHGYPTIYQGDLLLSYQTNSSLDVLMRYNGTLFTNYLANGYELDFDSPVVIGNTMYMRYVQTGPNGVGFLAKFDGTTVTIVPNPPNHTNIYCGLKSVPGFELGGNLHMRFRNNAGQYNLYKYDGTTLSLIPIPAGHNYVDNFAANDDPYLFRGKYYLTMSDANGAYYLGEYDGNTLIQIPSPSNSLGSGSGYFGYPIGIDTVLYLRFDGGNGPYLAKFADDTILGVPVANGMIYIGAPVEYNNYFAGKFRDSFGDYHLGTSDGDTVVVFPHPAGFNPQWDYGFSYDPINFGGYIYFGYDIYSGSHLARFDGQSVIALPNPVGFSNAGYQGENIILGTYLFMKFRGNNQNDNLAKLDTCGNSFASISPSACASYTAPDGQVLTASGNYVATIPNMYGCDSVISMNLIIYQNSSSTINASACDSYTAPDGQVYSGSGTYNATIPNFGGCDSLITINLVMDSNTSSTITASDCNVYVAPDGMSYSSSGTYTASIPNAVGCDSLITIQLTIPTIYTAVSANGPNLLALAGGATYQWLNCSNGFSAIPGATGQSFTAVSSGSYAVIVTVGGCSDTSSCLNVTIVGQEIGFESGVLVYPNPASTKFFVRVNEPMKGSIYTANGKLVKQLRLEETTCVTTDNWAAGLYFLRFQNAEGKTSTLRVMVGSHE